MEGNNTHPHGGRTHKLERIASGVLMAVAFLLPMFFIPSGLFSVPFSKSLIVYVGIVLSLVLYIFSILESGRLRIPKNPIIYIALCIPAVFLASSLFSSSIETSLVGYGFETGTFAFILLMFIFLFLVSTVYSKPERVFNSYLLYLISFAVVAVFQIARLFFPEALSFGVFPGANTNMVGSWNDLGVFFAISTLLALITLETLPLAKLFRIVLGAALALSLVFLAIVNFTTLWYILAAFSLTFMLYLLFARYPRPDQREGERRVSYLSLGVLVVSVMFIFAGEDIGGWIADAIKVANLEVRPSWTATFEVARNTVGQNALLGSGPNTFANQWLAWKPAEINSSLFWNTEFSYGIGLIPTFLVTTGALGFLAWAAFLGSIVYVGVRAIFSGNREPLPRYLMLSSFAVSLLLWVITIVYVPSTSIIALAFFFTGLFIASAYNEGQLSFKDVMLYQNSKLGFVSVLVLVFTLILSVGGAYFVSRNFVSSMYFQKSLRAATVSGDLDAAERFMVRAIELRDHDIYYRSLSEIKILRLNNLLTQQNNAPVEELRQRFQLTLGDAVASALKAVEVNPTNYQNHVALGRIYESVAPEPFKIEGAFQKAKETYEKALALNPTSPEIHLLLARLEMANNNLDGAREHLNRSLEQKSNYVDAYFLLSQVEVASGNLKKAIASAESATYLAPNNAGVYFQLGLLKYNDKDFQGAVGAFERAVGIMSDYANAKYFLGLSYDKVGRKQDAIKQFEDLRSSNPENQEVVLILENLRAGRDPFTNVAPPLDNQPEKRENPPVEER